MTPPLPLHKASIGPDTDSCLTVAVFNEDGTEFLLDEPLKGDLMERSDHPGWPATLQEADEILARHGWWRGPTGMTWRWAPADSVGYYLTWVERDPDRLGRLLIRGQLTAVEVLDQIATEWETAASEATARGDDLGSGPRRDVFYRRAICLDLRARDLRRRAAELRLTN